MLALVLGSCWSWLLPELLSCPAIITILSTIRIGQWRMVFGRRDVMILLIAWRWRCATKLEDDCCCLLVEDTSLGDAEYAEDVSCHPLLYPVAVAV